MNQLDVGFGKGSKYENNVSQLKQLSILSLLTVKYCLISEVHSNALHGRGDIQSTKCYAKFTRI
ncbi:CLUMA_CG016812, isoform A [Clunio marinus]|uniref:CLUMA_CG016812, isoform A n=1 Tax=Clunio marinus TaxID=568069 RepID=A0A1J1IUM3_9DIPT|nr:CLUMA_CG016812, isoform A [Clunio marinus]